MLVLFQALFTWSEPAITLIEGVVGAAQTGVGGLLPPGPLRDLLVDGVDRRRRQRRRLRAADRAALPVHRGDGGRRLSGARRLRHRPRDGEGRAARQVVRAHAVGVLVRGPGGDGHADAREPHRSPADDDGAAADVVQRAPADLRADHRHGVRPGRARLRPGQRRRAGAVCDVRAVGGGGADRGGRAAAHGPQGARADAAPRAAALPVAGRQRAGAFHLAAGALVSGRRRHDHPRAHNRDVGAAQLSEKQRRPRRGLPPNAPTSRRPLRASRSGARRSRHSTRRSAASRCVTASPGGSAG